MKDYIINAPQLQTVRKRISAVFVWLLCWVMWIYLLIPLVALSNWVMGDKKMINEMRWFGGYKSLLELMEIYMAALVVMTLLWLCWIFARALHSQVATYTLYLARARYSGCLTMSQDYLRLRPLWETGLCTAITLRGTT